MEFYIRLLLGIALIAQSCNVGAQKTNMDKSKEMNLACDIETGACEPTEQTGIEEISIQQVNKVKLIYYTDPICSACWAIEPHLKRFKMEYGQYVDVEYKMGGLLPGWEGFADKANGIAKPSDVAHHWDEVGQNSGMSIDGDVWLEDPLNSSFPPSIAFKAAQKQGEAFALKFLRRIREQVFLEKKNITKVDILLAAIEVCRGDKERFLKDYQNEATKQEFLVEMQQGRNYGVRGFPTFIFISNDGKGFKISGMSGYENYVLALEKAYGEKILPRAVNTSALTLLEKYSYLSTREISFVLSKNESETIQDLNELVEAGKITKESQKYGDFWRIIPSK